MGSEGRSERRIGDLESGIERLRNHQEMLKRKLKKQAERKQKLEVKSFAILCLVMFCNIEISTVQLVAIISEICAVSPPDIIL